MYHPTGKGIRNDAGGAGYYGAPRTKTLPSGQVTKYKHPGVDYSCDPGQAIFMPATGMIVRLANPYVNSSYRGLLIDTKRVRFKMFYFDPDMDLIGKVVKIGLLIGKAQDISLQYPGQGVTPHIHFEIIKCDPEILFNE